MKEEKRIGYYRSIYPSGKFPFSDGLCNFMDQNPDFYYSLKLANSDRFIFTRCLSCSQSPVKPDDEVLGLYYIDRVPDFCRRHNNYCRYKQDYIVNVSGDNHRYISYVPNFYEANNNVRPIQEFFDKYGEKGKYYHRTSSSGVIIWQHHYNSLNELPDIYREFIENFEKSI